MENLKMQKVSFIDFLGITSIFFPENRGKRLPSYLEQKLFQVNFVLSKVFVPLFSLDIYE